MECGLQLQKEKLSDIQPYENELSIEYHLRNYKKSHAVENSLLNIRYAHQCVFKLFDKINFLHIYI